MIHCGRRLGIRDDQGKGGGDTLNVTCSPSYITALRHACGARQCTYIDDTVLLKFGIGEQYPGMWLVRSAE